jgi:4-amino-4-deoxy-L-arabinose transferase-like glycosyltransferase
MFMKFQLLDPYTKGPTSFFIGLSLAFLCFTLFFANSGMTLWDDDEAAYAGFAMHMLETGNWVNPEFSWAEVHRKTPFHFWSIAVSYLLFGVNEFAVRFPSALAVLLTFFVLQHWGRTIWGKAQSNWAAIIFSTSLLVVSMGKMSLTDAWLMFFITSATLSLLNYIERPHWRWNLALWLSISIGILVKGPPIIIVLGGIWLTLAILHPDRKNLIHTHPWFYGIFALIPFVSWCYASYLTDGGQLLTFLYEWYIVERIGGSVFGQTGPPGYHLVIAIISFFPFLPFFLRGIWKSFRFARKDRASIALVAWLVFAWIFFELMSSKLPSYAMAAHPAFALFTADSILQFLKKEKTWVFWEKLIMALLCLAIAIALYWVASELFPHPNYVLFTSIPLALIALSLFFLKKTTTFIWPWVFSASLLLSAWSIGIEVLHQSPAMSSRRIIKEFKANAPETATEIAVCGFSAKQLRISFMVYLEQDWGSDIKEWQTHEAISALKKAPKTYILVGEAAWPAIKNAIDQGKIQVSWGKLPEWWSLNDQLKAHPFYWVRQN